MQTKEGIQRNNTPRDRGSSRDATRVTIQTCGTEGVYLKCLCMYIDCVTTRAKSAWYQKGKRITWKHQWSAHSMELLFGPHGRHQKRMGTETTRVKSR